MIKNFDYEKKFNWDGEFFLKNNLNIIMWSLLL